MSPQHGVCAVPSFTVPLQMGYKVISFEASPRNYWSIMGRANYSTAGVDWRNLAVSNSTGNITFCISPGAESFLDHIMMPGDRCKGKPTVVNMTTLDENLGAIDNIRMIKVTRPIPSVCTVTPPLHALGVDTLICGPLSTFSVPQLCPRAKERSVNPPFPPHRSQKMAVKGFFCRGPQRKTHQGLVSSAQRPILHCITCPIEPFLGDIAFSEAPQVPKAPSRAGLVSPCTISCGCSAEHIPLLSKCIPAASKSAKMCVQYI